MTIETGPGKPRGGSAAFAGRLLAIAFLLGALSGCGDEPNNGMKAFCETYQSSLDAAERTPRTRPDFSSPPPGFQDYERALELAKTSGNERVEQTHAELTQQMDVSAQNPTNTDYDSYGDAFINAYRAAVEECDEAGYPIL